MSTEGAGAGEVLLGLALPLTVASLVMVYAMVQWSRALLGAGGHARQWGLAYAASWAAILLVLGRFLASEPGGLSARNLGLLVLVVGGFWALHALLVVFARAIQRANARATTEARSASAAGETPEEPEEEPEEDEDAAAAASAAPAPPPRGRLRSALTWVGQIVLVLVVIAIGEALPALQALERFAAAHRAALLAATLGPAVLGFLLLMTGAISMALGRGRPMSRREIEAMRARSLTAGRGGRATFRVRGMAIGTRAEDAASFAEVKAGWRERAWRWSPRWRRMFAMALGGLLMLIGGFGAVVVGAPPGIKLLFGGALVYALVRLARAFARA